MQSFSGTNIDESSMSNELPNTPLRKKKFCTLSQLLIILIPIGLIALFLAIFLPIFLSQEDKEIKKIYIIDDNIKSSNENISNIINYANKATPEDNEIDDFIENVANYSYATLTPKNGYDYIFIFLGGIDEPATKYLDFFKSNETIIPKRTKLIFLSGKERVMKYMEKYNYTLPVSGWFNVDGTGILFCEGCDDIYSEAKESLNFILDKIDEISSVEKIDYNKIFLGGFSQGGIMVNYILLNSRHELAGYLSFSGYIFDHHFPMNTVLTTLNDTQKEILEARKNYHFLASFSFNDNNIPYAIVVNAYYAYLKEYTDFQFYSFGSLLHLFTPMPIKNIVKKWIKERMI